MNHQFHKFLRKSAGGTALIELAIALPLVLLVGFGSLEVAKILRARQIMQSMTREIGAVAFRQCGWSTPEAAQECLNAVYELQFINRVLPQAGVILSIYDLESAGPPKVAVRLAARASNGFSSRVNANWATQLSSLTADNRRILVAEARLPFSATTKFIGKIFQQAELYDAILF